MTRGWWPPGGRWRARCTRRRPRTIRRGLSDQHWSDGPCVVPVPGTGDPDRGAAAVQVGGQIRMILRVTAVTPSRVDAHPVGCVMFYDVARQGKRTTRVTSVPVLQGGHPHRKAPRDTRAP
jgi:hypothetical protein